MENYLSQGYLDLIAEGFIGLLSRNASTCPPGKVGGDAILRE